MKTRLKTFGEFEKGIIIAYSEKGCKIVCKLKNYVLFDAKYKPWNSAATRKIFLMKLYLSEIIKKKDLSKKIARITGFELLGKRCYYKDTLCIICNAEEGAFRETGEMTTRLTLTTNILSHPFKLLIEEVQL